MKPGLIDRFSYAESGGWKLARILVMVGPAILVFAIGMTMFFEAWN